MGNGHPLSAMVNMARTYGHTALDVHTAKRMRKKFPYRLETVQPAFDSGELILLGEGDGRLVTTPRAALSEALCALWLARGRAARPLPLKVEQGGSQAHYRLPMAPSQARAVGTLASGGGGLLTGKPGTGKTWLTANMIHQLMATRLVSVACPTGKAASVLSRKLGGLEVTTVHRMLGLIPGQSPEYCRWNPLPVDIVIIDEASMLDAKLMGYVVDALGEASLLLVGDPNQLPSVEAGAPFSDLVSSNALPHAHLTDIQRQAEGSGIIRMAHDWSNGKCNIDYPNITRYNVPDRELEARTVDWMVNEEWRRFGAESFKDVLILTPTKQRKYEAGTRAINHKVSSILAAKHNRRRVGRTKFHVDDRILFTRNDYGTGWRNGHLGTIKDVSGSRMYRVTIEADSGDEYIVDSEHFSSNAEHAYALTVHKAQGSESKVVNVLLHREARFMYTRELVYTAATRASEELLFVGSPSVLTDAVKKRERRITCLPHLIKDTATARRIVDSCGYGEDLSSVVGVF